MKVIKTLEAKVTRVRQGEQDTRYTLQQCQRGCYQFFKIDLGDYLGMFRSVIA